MAAPIDGYDFDDMASMGSPSLSARLPHDFSNADEWTAPMGRSDPFDESQFYESQCTENGEEEFEYANEEHAGEQYADEEAGDYADEAAGEYDMHHADDQYADEEAGEYADEAGEYDTQHDASFTQSSGPITFEEYTARSSARSATESDRYERELYKELQRREHADAHAARHSSADLAQNAVAEAPAAAAEAQRAAAALAASVRPMTPPPPELCVEIDDEDEEYDEDEGEYSADADEDADEADEAGDSPEPSPPPPPAEWPAFDEEEAMGAPVEMGECGLCARRFNLDRLEKHQSACKKTATLGKKRKTFDVRGQRWQATDAEQFVKAAAKRGDLAKPDPAEHISAREQKRKKWQKESAAIRRASSAAKLAGGGAVGEVVMPVEEEDDRVQCPHCSRKFAALPAERHIAKCKDIRAKPKTVKRSDASSAPMMRAKGGKEAATKESEEACGAGASRFANASPVPSLDLSGIGGGPPNATKAKAKPPPAKPPAKPPTAAKEEKHAATPAASAPPAPPAGTTPKDAADEKPPPPPELEQLHALGDAKFGKGRTAGRRPPAAPSAPKPPSVVDGGADEKPAAKPRRQSSGYGAINQNARKPSTGASGGGSAPSSAAPSPKSGGRSPASTASASPKPRRASSSGYGAINSNARKPPPPPSASVPTGGSGSGRTSSSGQPSPSRSSASDRSSGSSASRTTGKKAVQPSPGMRPPVAKRVPGNRQPPGSPHVGNAAPRVVTRGSPAAPTGARKPAAPPASKKVLATGSVPPSPRVPMATLTNSNSNSPAPAASGRDAREAKMRAEMNAREKKLAAKHAADGAAPTLSTLPFFKVAADAPPVDVTDAPPPAPPAPPAPIMLPQTPEHSNPGRASFLRSPSAKSPTGMLRAGGGFGDRGSLVADHAASGDPLKAMPQLTKQPSLEQMARTCASPSPYGGFAAVGFDATPGGGCTDGRLFERAGTSEYRPRVGGGGDKENDLPAYQEVRVERFGWRRRSFISRQNSVLLAR